MRRLQGSLLDALQGLWFVPGAIAAAYGGLAIAMVEIDQRTGLKSGPLFEGDGSAARTVLSVIAGSLITVAGLTFSITVVVLQLTSSQFSPRILRTFFGDRLTQITVGSFVGIFVYSLLVLRSVGSAPSNAFVPRLGVTVATAFAIVAVALLIVFIHHVTQLIQVSHVTGGIARETLARLDVLYPSPYGQPVESVDVPALIEAWNDVRPGLVFPKSPGYVRRIDVDDLAKGLGDPVERAVVLVRPGDFVSIEQPLAAIWPASEASAATRVVRRVCRIERERDLAQDLDFGLRQLTDTAVKAMSPGINDPTTACTCVGYIRSILVRLAEREFPAPVRRFPGRGLAVVVPPREFDEYVDCLAEIGRYSDQDVRVTGTLLGALASVSRAAHEAGIERRAAAAREIALAIGKAAVEGAANDRDRATTERLLAEIRSQAAPAGKDRPPTRLVEAQDAE